MTIWFNKLDNTLHDDMDGAALHLSSWPQGMLEATEEQINVITRPSDTVLWQEYKAKALSELEKSDLVALRCWKAGIAYPQEWVKYDNALRNIVSSESGDPTKPLPIKPEPPKGI